MSKMTTGLEKLIRDFLATDLISITRNYYTGTYMVEYRSCGRIVDCEALELGRRIMRHKRDMRAMDARIAARRAA
jgi:hypothetical protein